MMSIMNRRDFLKVGSKIGGGLMVSIYLPAYGKSITSDQTVADIEFNKFISIDTNGEITIMLTKHEMGQGTGTAIPTIIADELEADWSKIKIKQATYDPKYTWLEMGTTGGSGSIARTWDAVRTAGAATKALLKQAAANAWGVDPIVLEVKKSYVTNRVTNQTFRFGELAEEAAKLTIPKDIDLKKPGEYVYVGKSVKNRITKDVVSGNMKYGIDMDISGMVYASIERCPIYKGRIKNYDDSEVKKVKGVLDVFPIAIPQKIKDRLHPIMGYVYDGIAIVASSTWVAFKARKLLRVEWDGGENANRDIASLNDDMGALKDSPSLMSMDLGDVGPCFQNPENTILEMEYNTPYQTHAVMEPLNATAHFQDDICEIWVGIQDPEKTIDNVSKALEIPKEKINIHVLKSGGSFGRRYAADTSIEAAFISKKIRKPVKLTWTREDEIKNDHCQPYLKNYMTAAITPKKSVEAIENQAICTIDYAVWSTKWDHYYAFPNIRCHRSTVPALLQYGAWRSVGEHSAALSKECFVDELAHNLGKDPLDYRLELLSHEVDWGDPKEMSQVAIERMLPRKKLLRQRQIEVLSYIKANGLWSKEEFYGRGKGLAMMCFGDTVCAEIAEVTMEGEFGYRVDKITAVVHCGMVINPHFGKGQIEGSIIWALSAVKYGGVEIENGAIQRSNFHDNKVLRIDELPKIEVIFMESDERPSGLGEPGTPPLAPAVLNAIFNACGKRIRKIPVTKEDLVESTSKI
ncbi:MAG: molybdopterin cofactor-binding domain-containing protein [Bacteroidota bacterium]